MLRLAPLHWQPAQNQSNSFFFVTVYSWSEILVLRPKPDIRYGSTRILRIEHWARILECLGVNKRRYTQYELVYIANELTYEAILTYHRCIKKPLKRRARSATLSLSLWRVLQLVGQHIPFVSGFYEVQMGIQQLFQSYQLEERVNTCRSLFPPTRTKRVIVWAWANRHDLYVRKGWVIRRVVVRTRLAWNILKWECVSTRARGWCDGRAPMRIQVTKR